MPSTAASAQKPVRPIRVVGDIAFVPLTKGYEAIIDAADVHLVEEHNWCAKVFHRKDGSIQTVYAVRSERSGGKQHEIRMHRVLADTPDGMETDHHDGNGLNNRQSNLRDATRSQNQHNQRVRADNSSGAKGVGWDKTKGKWRVRIGLNGKVRSLGRYTDINEASAAYAKASAEFHGKFGRVES